MSYYLSETVSGAKYKSLFREGDIVIAVGRANVVPVHSAETIGPGLLSKNLRDVEMTKDNLLKGWKK